jgi:integrase/recombinase XerD
MNISTPCPPTILSLAEDFFLDLKLKNRTPATIKSYRWYLGKFLKYLDENGIEYPNQLTGEVFRGYHLDLFLSRKYEARRGAAWVNPYLVPIKTFIEFLKLSEWMPDDPAYAISFARAPLLIPKEILTREEMVDLIEAPDITTVLGYRDRTIMELLYTTAIRRNECRNLTIPDVNFEDGLLRVFGKGRKERIVPIGRIALKFLDNYVMSVRPLLMKKKSEMRLFLSVKGNSLSRNVMGEFITRYAEQAGIDKRVTPHTFRHTCATLMLRNRADVRHIQALLGHESLNSTQIYTHVAVADLREILAKYHPREIDS